jgi:ubiquinone biosynthesis monooxygenase Coq7
MSRLTSTLIRQQPVRVSLQCFSRRQSSLASAPYTHPTSPDESTTTTSSTLTQAQRESLGEMLRVDHSGEIAANTIYLAQSRVFALMGDQKTSKMMLDMLESEKKHLKVAEKLLQQHRIRPSVLAPVWGLAGSILGAATALLGKEGAMAATEAVETVIGEHYDE